MTLKTWKTNIFSVEVLLPHLFVELLPPTSNQILAIRYNLDWTQRRKWWHVELRKVHCEYHEEQLNPLMSWAYQQRIKEGSQYLMHLLIHSYFQHYEYHHQIILAVKLHSHFFKYLNVALLHLSHVIGLHLSTSEKKNTILIICELVTLNIKMTKGVIIK